MEWTGLRRGCGGRSAGATEAGDFALARVSGDELGPLPEVVEVLLEDRRAVLLAIVEGVQDVGGAAPPTPHLRANPREPTGGPARSAGASGAGGPEVFARRGTLGHYQGRSK